MKEPVRAFVIMAAFLSAPRLEAAVESFRGGVGLFDIFDHAQTVLISLEVGFSDFSRFEITPLLGGWVTEKGDVLIHGGLERSFQISHDWFVIPGFSVSAYLKDDGKELGQVLEFVSRINIAYQIDADSRLRIGLSHISNGHLASINPGSEILSIEYEQLF